MNHETLYLKEAFGPSIEFPNNAGVFQLDAFPDLTAFMVLLEEPSVVQANVTTTSNASTVASIPNVSKITTRASINLSRRASACVKIIRAHLGNSGKPLNLRLHNHTVHVNIYSEERACVTYLLYKIRDEMVEEDFLLVGASELIIYEQDGSRGKLLVSFFATCCRVVTTFCPLKLTSQGFGLFFQNNIFHPWIPQLLQYFGQKHTCLKC